MKHVSFLSQVLVPVGLLCVFSGPAAGQVDSTGLTAEQREVALASAGLRVDEVGTWSFRELEQAHRGMAAANVPEATRESLIIEWLEGREVESLDDPSHVGWLLSEVARLGTQSAGFSVRWTGLVEVPQDGAYTFSICPINVNYEAGDEFARQTMRVWVGDELVLASSPDEWKERGTPITLTAGRREPIRVELVYARSEETDMTRHPAIAKLSWEGPAVARTLIPQRALFLPEGGANGLRAEYRLDVDGQEQSVTQTEAMIDHGWLGTFPVIPRYRELQSRLIGRFLTLALAPEYLAAWEGEEKPATPHAFWMQPDLLELMDSSQQAACLGELSARPVLLESQPGPSTVRLYWTCRVGAGEAALDLLGTWAQLHPDAEPTLAESYEQNRLPFALLPEAMVWQYPAHQGLFEDRYLEMPDGGCCLPVAYVLGYGYRQEGRIERWIEKLEKRLAELPRVGDVRVNWLLARAQAEEIRLGRTGRFSQPPYRFLAGRGWLDDARLVAHSEPVRLRAYKELVLRLAARERLDEARQLVEKAAGRFSEPSSTALAAWEQQIDRAAERVQANREASEAQAQRAYVKRLQERRRKAMEADDRGAVTRYDQILTAAGAKVER